MDSSASGKALLIKLLLLSVLLAVVVMSLSILLAYYSSTHQDSFLALPGYLVAAFLALPIVILFGHDRKVSTVAIAAVALFETLILSSAIFPVLSLVSIVRSARRNSG
jgi:hypothetical protein